MAKMLFCTRPNNHAGSEFDSVKNVKYKRHFGDLEFLIANSMIASILLGPNFFRKKTFSLFI